MCDALKIFLVLLLIVLISLVLGRHLMKRRETIVINDYRTPFDKELFQGSVDPQIDSTAQRQTKPSDPVPYEESNMAQSNSLSPIKNNTNVMSPPQMSNTYSPMPNMNETSSQPLMAKDLLPRDDPMNNWNLSNPQPNGHLGDKNFLETSHFYGVATSSGSLRNANLQIRSDPIVQKVDNFTPWSWGSYGPDMNRKQFEIGSA
jgi:hypothetical protein